MSIEQTGKVTMKGNPVTLLGPALKAGDAAPEFKLVDNGLKEVTLADSKGKTRVICAVPSLDTPVCAIETKKFNEKAAELGDGVVVYTVSLDLPFAQKRFCGAENITRNVPLSDYKHHTFGMSYGVLMKENGLLARAVFVVGPDDKLKHVQIVPEIAQEPDYDAALAAAK